MFFNDTKPLDILRANTGKIRIYCLLKLLTLVLEADVPLNSECLHVLNARKTEEIPKLLEKDMTESTQVHTFVKYLDDSRH